MTDERTQEDIDALRDLLVKQSPTAWTQFGAHGIVLVGNTSEDEAFLLLTTREWAKEGFAFRAPHHSVSTASLLGKRGGEVALAMGGILLLLELSLFSTAQLRRMAEQIERDRAPITVIGFDYFHSTYGTQEQFTARMRSQAKALGLQLVTMDEIGDEPASDVSAALDEINRHRLSIGMARLDPAAFGWTDEDVRLEAERIERLPNPLLDLKRELLRCQNPPCDQIGLFGAKQAEVEGFALFGQRGKAVRARPGRGTQEDLVSRKVSAEKMLEMREREIAERAAKKSARKRKGKRKKNPERWLAPRLSPSERTRLKQLHDVYFDLFDELESLPGATLTTPTGEYVVPEGYALLYRVGDTDYLIFQDEAPAETWSFIAVGRDGMTDRVDHLEDYLAVLERINDAVIREVIGRDERNRGIRP